MSVRGALAALLLAVAVVAGCEGGGEATRTRSAPNDMPEGSTSAPAPTKTAEGSAPRTTSGTGADDGPVDEESGAVAARATLPYQLWYTEGDVWLQPVWVEGPGTRAVATASSCCSGSEAWFSRTSIR
jgi:hypothetical protein